MGLGVNQKSGGYPCDSCASIIAVGTSCLASGIAVCKVQSWEKPLLIPLPDACIELLAGRFCCDSWEEAQLQHGFFVLCWMKYSAIVYYYLVLVSHQEEWQKPVLFWSLGILSRQQLLMRYLTSDTKIEIQKLWLLGLALSILDLHFQTTINKETHNWSKRISDTNLFGPKQDIYIIIQLYYRLFYCNKTPWPEATYGRKSLFWLTEG